MYKGVWMTLWISSEKGLLSDVDQDVCYYGQRAEREMYSVEGPIVCIFSARSICIFSEAIILESDS